MRDLARQHESLDSEAVVCCALLELMRRIEIDDDPDRTGKRLETVSQTWERLTLGERRVKA